MHIFCKFEIISPVLEMSDWANNVQYEEAVRNCEVLFRRFDELVQQFTQNNDDLIRDITDFSLGFPPLDDYDLSGHLEWVSPSRLGPSNLYPVPKISEDIEGDTESSLDSDSSELDQNATLIECEILPSESIATNSAARESHSNEKSLSGNRKVSTRRARVAKFVASTSRKKKNLFDENRSFIDLSYDDSFDMANLPSVATQEQRDFSITDITLSETLKDRYTMDVNNDIPEENERQKHILQNDSSMDFA